MFEWAFCGIPRKLRCHTRPSSGSRQIMAGEVEAFGGTKCKAHQCHCHTHRLCRLDGHIDVPARSSHMCQINRSCQCPTIAQCSASAVYNALQSAPTYFVHHERQLVKIIKEDKGNFTITRYVITDHLSKIRRMYCAPCPGERKMVDRSHCSFCRLWCEAEVQILDWRRTTSKQ